MILRRAFLKRMALAAAACALIDVPWPEHLWPNEPPGLTARYNIQYRIGDGPWYSLSRTTVGSVHIHTITAASGVPPGMQPGDVIEWRAQFA